MSDSLGDRMKDYENVTKTSVLRRTPVIIRVDGKAFHTYTKQFSKTLTTDPFSDILHELMTATATSMVSYMQNAVIAYTQSDEISILLKDWTTLTTDQWFGGGVQKMASVSAAMAAAYFNFHLNRREDLKEFHPTFVGAIPLFDARVFNLPKEEVTNYFIWRQQDATRNSINMLGQYYFSHKELHGKNVSQVQDMLMLQKGINWDKIAVWKKRGSCIVETGSVYSSSMRYSVDDEIPIFTQDRNYIEQWLGESNETK